MHEHPCFNWYYLKRNPSVLFGRQLTTGLRDFPSILQNRWIASIHLDANRKTHQHA
jgi:hypothetical protein